VEEVVGVGVGVGADVDIDADVVVGMVALLTQADASETTSIMIINRTSRNMVFLFI
jgi:hypothetical protein